MKTDATKFYLRGALARPAGHTSDIRGPGLQWEGGWDKMRTVPNVITILTDEGTLQAQHKYVNLEMILGRHRLQSALTAVGVTEAKNLRTFVVVCLSIAQSLQVFQCSIISLTT